MMHNFKGLTLASTFLITSIFSVSAAASDGFKKITTEAEFIQLAVGRKMYLVTDGKISSNDNYAISLKNGILKGKFSGKALKGNWAWRNGYWCRTLATHNKDTDCQSFEVNGDTFRITRERGKGKVFTYIAK